jgi:hypothetical protein
MEFSMKKSENFEICNFSIFQKSGDFAGFSIGNWLYLCAEFTDLDSKTSFGKFIKFYYEV